MTNRDQRNGGGRGVAAQLTKPEEGGGGNCFSNERWVNNLHKYLHKVYFVWRSKHSFRFHVNLVSYLLQCSQNNWRYEQQHTTQSRRKLESECNCAVVDGGHPTVTGNLQ